MTTETRLRQIDALIAEKVFGLVPCTDPVRRCEAAHLTPPQCWGNGAGGSDLATYTTSWDAAGQVVEKITSEGASITCSAYRGGASAAIWGPGVARWRPIKFQIADTLPLAVALAALRSLGVEVPG